MRYKATVEYDGSEFHGWQFQPNEPTVQGAIEKALFDICGEQIRITGSGRTDAGVHAKGQVFHFDSSKDLGGKWRSGLNYYLPQTIRVLDVEKTDDEFHARFSAKLKTYKYVFLRRTESALMYNRALCCGDLDTNIMQKGAELFVGKHDFCMLRSLGSDVNSTVRTVTSSTVVNYGDFTVFSITADGFLYNMVRKSAAALRELGEGKISIDNLKRIVDAQECFSSVALPCGLYLWEVKYER